MTYICAHCKKGYYDHLINEYCPNGTAFKWFPEAAAITDITAAVSMGNFERFACDRVDGACMLSDPFGDYLYAPDVNQILLEFEVQKNAMLEVIEEQRKALGLVEPHLAALPVDVANEVKIALG